MGELIIELYANKISFGYKEGCLAVGSEWNKSERYTSVDYNKSSEGAWVVTHFYEGFKKLSTFYSVHEVIDFFKRNETAASKDF